MPSEEPVLQPNLKAHDMPAMNLGDRSTGTGPWTIEIYMLYRIGMCMKQTPHFIIAC